MTVTHITELLPQRPPFVMIDEILEADDKISRGRFEIREGHLFVENGFFTEPGIVEHIAQTAGAGTGYKYKKAGKPTPMGYIGAIKNLNIIELPKVGDTLITEIAFVATVMSVHMVQGRVYNDGKEIANCELKIFLQQ